ncbi:MAG: hypothetical protein R3E31_20145 [Chloroflexota bacterium]
MANTLSRLTVARLVWAMSGDAADGRGFETAVLGVVVRSGVWGLGVRHCVDSVQHNELA